MYTCINASPRALHFPLPEARRATHYCTSKPPYPCWSAGKHDPKTISRQLAHPPPYTSRDGLRKSHLAQPDVGRVEEHLWDVKALVSHRQDLKQQQQ